MDYSLPHAVLAFLQEENSPCSPKSYFISSSTKSTKITLIYTRDRKGNFKSSRKKSRHHSSSNNNNNNHRERHSSSSTDDYTQRPHSVHSCRYVDGNHGKQRHRICASTPGRGYSDAARVHEIQRSAGSAKMATDPVLRHSPSRDHLTINHFTNGGGDHHDSDSDVSYHYAPLSPSSVISERPPTPGRFFDPSDTPRPPTPNASNYASLVFTGNSTHTSTYHSLSRDAIPQHNDGDPMPRPLTPGAHHPTTGDARQSKTKGTNDKPKSSGSKANPTRSSLPPIKVCSPSPDAPPTLARIQPITTSSDSRPPYQRHKSADGSRR